MCCSNCQCKLLQTFASPYYIGEMAKRQHRPDHQDTSFPKKTSRGFREAETKDDPLESGDLTHFIKDSAMISQLKKHGITSLFPIQQSTFHAVLKGHDLTARDRTGSGKTLAYALPAIERMRRDKLLEGNLPKILVMVPTRQLAMQVTGCFQKLAISELNLRVVAVYGGDGMRRQMDVVERGVDVVVATPGRLIDFVNRGVVKFDSLQCLVLDEADEMLKQGFQEDIEKIFKAVMEQTSKKPQTLLFSATIPSWVKNISERYQEKNCTMVDLVGNSAVSVPKTIKHLQLPIRHQSDIPQVVKKLCKSMLSREGRCIIFCETKREVNNLNNELEGEGCRMLHGDVKQCDRERIYRDFKSGKVLKVVATNVAARGLDFPNIELVIQVEPPRQVEAYIHRAGRTGRAGKEGTSVVLVQKRDRNRLQPIEREGGFCFEELNERDL